MSAEISPHRQELRTEISGIPQIFEGEPKDWWFRASIYIAREIRKYPEMSHDVKASVGEFLIRAKELLAAEAEVVFPEGASEEDLVRMRAERAESVLMKISFDMAKRFEPIVDPIKENIITIDQMINGWPDMFVKEGGRFGIKIPTTGDYYFIEIPEQNTIWYKGGISRVLLNIVAGADTSMILSDLPPNDHDGIAIGKSYVAHEEAKRMGIDADGLELYKGESLDFARFCQGRDSTQNQAFFGRDGLHFSDAAYQSAKTGFTKIVGKYIPEKAIYGVDLVYVKGHELVKPRGQMRLIKALSEGKIKSFEHKPLSTSLDVGLYVMFLAKRWSKKQNFPELLQNMFEVLKRMGHVREGEKDIFSVLKRAHKEYPFFEFGREIKDIVEVVGWKSRKLVKQIDREFAWLNKDSAGFVLERKPNDSVPQIITLDGFLPDSSQNQRLLSKWSKYLVHCHNEFKEYQSQKLTRVERLFRKSDVVDFEDMDLGDSEQGIFLEGAEEI